MSKKNNPATEPAPVTTRPPADNLRTMERKSISTLEAALDAVRELSAARAAAKLSSSRLVGVARELRELLRLMSVYGC